MKNLKYLSVLVLSFVFLASCEKQESEENKPQELSAQSKTDLIKKVYRYGYDGSTIEDSILFTYDSQNRLSEIKYRPVKNGLFSGKKNYSYSFDQASNSNVVLEQDSILNIDAPGKYMLWYAVKYFLNGNYQQATRIEIPKSNLAYSVTYDSLGFLKTVHEIPKQFNNLNFNFIWQNNNLHQAFISRENPNSTGTFTHEYYPESYKHDLNFEIYDGYGHGGLWNWDLNNLHHNKYVFLGKKNTQLLKKQTYTSDLGTDVVDYQYEFNAKGLVSKIRSEKVTTSNNGPRAGSPMATRYEIFYY